MKIEDKVKNFWEDCGSSNKAGGLVTHKDTDQVAMEKEVVCSFINTDDTLLDIGCGNGYSTNEYAKRCKSVVGLDYAQNMIDIAKKTHVSDNLKFEQLDVLNLNESFGKFSLILSTRCLINLMSWEKQQEAITSIHKCLSDGGRFILIEGSQQGRTALNELRVTSGLDAMKPVWHNLDMDEEKLKPFLKDMFEIENDIRFGLYDMLTRVYYPASIHPKEPEYGTKFHKAARTLSQTFSKDSVPQYSREFILVLKKK